MTNQPNRKKGSSDRKKRIEGILFDIGGTLINASRLINEALNEAAESLRTNGYVTKKDKFEQTYREVDRNIQGSHINHLFSDLYIIQKTWQKLKLSPSYPAYGTFLVAFRNHVRANIKADKEICNMFRLLKDRKVKLGVVSDGTVVEQLETLVYLGIIKYFDAIVVSEEFEVEKPDSILFHTALKQLHTKPENTLMVGDDLVRDIWGAKSVGMKTALVTEHKAERPPQIETQNADFVFRRISEIVDLVDG